jgi:hypothetical protein
LNHKKLSKKYFNIYLVNIIRFKDWMVESAPIEYYRCNDCGSVYQQYDPRMAKCRYCSSKDVRMTDEEDYISNANPEEVDGILRSKDETEKGYIDPKKLTRPNMHPYFSVKFDREHVNKLDEW